MKTRFLLTLLVACPALLPAQRPTIPTKIDPRAAVTQLQVVRAGPGGGPHTAAQPLQLAQTHFLSAAARRELLARGSVSGTPADQPLLVEPAPRGARAYIALTNPTRVANIAGGGLFGEVRYGPYAHFMHSAAPGWEGVSIHLQPERATRYLADCRVGGHDRYRVESSQGRLLLNASTNEEREKHLTFLVEVTEPALGGGFELTSEEDGPWAFLGCELTPILD
jgi:hypothetical protein